MTDQNIAGQIAARRQVEDKLLQLGQAHAETEAIADLNRTAVQSWLVHAREAGITVADIVRMTGYSKQSLHAWMRERMVPIPTVHLGLGDPPPQTLEDAVLRTIGGEPDRPWTALQAHAAIPDDWPTGTVHDVAMALDMLARSGQIWPTDSGYQVADPDPDARGRDP